MLQPQGIPTLSISEDGSNVKTVKALRTATLLTIPSLPYAASLELQRALALKRLHERQQDTLHRHHQRHALVTKQTYHYDPHRPCKE